MKLTPKDTSILIFLASSEGKSISLDKIYKNFWPKSGNPPRNLAHLLVRLRKSLRLPSHFLYVKENKLIYNCYFTSDYDEYQEHLAQAKVLLRAGEWEFAKQEFHQAFKLFRREPFRKMYDDWSDDKRLEILFSYETEVVSFSKELIKRGREEEAHKLLKNAEKVQKSRVKI
jgi:DNA-binding SARP family transcriptional activator